MSIGKSNEGGISLFLAKNKVTGKGPTSIEALARDAGVSRLPLDRLNGQENAYVVFDVVNRVARTMGLRGIEPLLFGSDDIALPVLSGSPTLPLPKGDVRSISQLASITGISRMSLSKLSRKQLTRMRVADLKKLADFFDLPVGYFTGYYST